MGFFKKQPAAATVAPVAASSAPAAKSPKAKEPAQAARWTNGNLLGTRAITVVVVAVWLCGPLALFVAHGASMTAREHATRTAPASAQLSTLQQASGALAVGFVSSWLSATPTNPGQLQSYLSVTPSTLSQTPFTFRNMAVASVSPQKGGSGLVDVVVAADVQESQLQGGKQTQAWVRRYYQVAVDTTGHQLAVVALPAPVSGPAVTSKQPGLGYGAQLPTTAKASQTVTLFLEAYLAGQGETEPYVSPSTTIPAITPAPYSQITPVAYLADQTPADDPADGATVAVLATVTAQNQVGQQVTATYTLQLRARAGRWEVKALETSPVLADVADSTAAPTPSPTGDPQEGNN